MKSEAPVASLWALFFFLLFGSVGVARASDGFDVQPAPRGAVLPTVVGTDLTGRVWKAADLRGKAVLVNFWASWCEPCRAEMPSLQAFQANHSDSVVVLAVNYKEQPEAVQRFVQRQGWGLPVITDPHGAQAKRWGIGIFPSSVLVNAQGRVVGVVRGEVDWQALSPSLAWFRNWLPSH